LVGNGENPSPYNERGASGDGPAPCFFFSFRWGPAESRGGPCAPFGKRGFGNSPLVPPGPPPSGTTPGTTAFVFFFCLPCFFGVPLSPRGTVFFFSARVGKKKNRGPPPKPPGPPPVPWGMRGKTPHPRAHRNRPVFSCTGPPPPPPKKKTNGPPAPPPLVFFFSNLPFFFPPETGKFFVPTFPSFRGFFSEGWNKTPGLPPPL